MDNIALEQVGAVVIGRNEGDRLIRCLEAVRNQTAAVVYVDSGSSDGSQQAALDRGVELVELDPNRPFSMARARNEGVKRLCSILEHAAYVQLIDGDCELAKNWTQTAIQTLNEHPKVAAVCGRRRERFPENSIYNRLCDIEWNTAIGQTDSCGGDALIRLEAFNQVGGFNEELIAGEEPEMCVRLQQNGWTILRIDTEMTLHDANILHFNAWWRRTVRCGYGARDVAHRLNASGFSGQHHHHQITRSAWLWSWGWLLVAIILCIGGATLFSWLGAVLGWGAGVALWGAQLLRIAKGVRPKSACLSDALAYGFFTLLGKWAQTAGQLKYLHNHYTNQKGGIIEYKSSTTGSWKQDRERYPKNAFFSEPSMRAIALYRFGRWSDQHTRGPLRIILNRLYWITFRHIELKTGCSFTKLVEIGPGLRIYHFGNIFIHSAAKIGSYCTLRHGVTIGNAREKGPAPVVGNHVEVGAYAQILGGITIGNDARIGAMSVVLQDVPPGATAVGVPARIIPATTTHQEQTETDAPE